MIHLRLINLTFIAASSLLSIPGQTTSASAEDLFPDKNLEAAVRRQVFSKRETDEPLTAEDVRNISTVTGKGKDISNLKGLEACISLAALDLENNRIDDLSPLAELKNIQTITLAKNRIKDVSPLAGLVKLQYLQLEYNDVNDVKPLEKLVNMNSIYLTRNKIKDISPLKGMKKLWSLYLGYNKITDLTPIKELTRVQTLDISGNGLSDLSPLSDWTDLNLVMMENNKISDLKTLVDMAKKDAESNMRFAPFWRLYLSGNPLSDQAKSEQLEELKKMGARINFKEKK